MEIIGAVIVLLVNVSVPANVASVPAVGKVTFVLPVAVNVCEKEPTVAKVLPCANVKVAEVAGVVSVNLFTLVAVATPKTGVTKVGEAKGAFKAKASKTAFCDGAIVVVPSLIASATEAPTAVDTASPTKAVVAMAVELLPAV